MSLQIYLFGTPRFEQDNQPVHIRRRKAVALLAYLAVTGQPHSRDALAALFWPEHDQSGARANLRRDLSRLRKALGKDALLVDRVQVSIAPQNIVLDVADFQVKVALAQRHSHAPEDLCPACLQALETAVAAYTGDFMAGFTLPDSPEFDDWQFFQREGYRRLFSTVLQQLLGWYVSRGEWEPAIGHGRRWLALDPLHEQAHRELMKLYAWSGQQAAALRQYQECLRLLDEELGVEPEDETTQLFELIKTRQLSPPAVKHAENESHPEIGPPARDLILTPVGVERFIQEELLATGGHGELYRGRDLVTDKPVVIKKLKPDLVTKDSEFVARFLREGEALRRLNHPNIVHMLGMFEEDGRHSIVMEYVSGGSLRKLIEQEVQLSQDRALSIALELADALSRAHHLGIIHRDLKPDNVLLAEDGTPRLTDFGVALLEREDTRLTPAGSFIGSPAYMSPEVVRGETPDARSDIWAFGVLLFEMLAGHPPFGGDRITSVLVSIMGDPLPDITKIRPDIYLALDSLLQRMLVKDQGARIPSMRQVAAELEAIRDGRVSSITATPIPFQPETAKPVAPPLPEQEIRYCLTKDNVRLAYATVGSGPPLVKAANWLSHLEYDWRSPVWRHWLTGLSAEHTLVRYDERGCGLSDWEVDDFTFAAWLRDLETVVDAAGLERFPLLGISQGGPIAIAYAVRHPERVSHLILYGTYARGKHQRNASPEQLEEMETLLKLVRLGWGKENPAFRQVFTSMFIPGGSKEQYEMFNELQRVSSSPENAARIIDGFGHINVTAEAGQVQAPTLVLHATNDSRIPFDEGKLVASLIPEARFIPLESENHILLEQEPAWQKFMDEVNLFLKKDGKQHRVWSPTTPLKTAVDPGEQQIRYTLSFDKTRIAYSSVGQGPPLVKTANYLSHLEYDWHSPIWGHLWQGLAQNHTLFRYDERGTGLSEWEVEDLSFNAWVQDLEAVVNAAGLERFALMGISQGGAVAIAYAVRHPEKVSHLILSGAYARGWLHRDLTPEQTEEREMLLQLMKMGWGKNNPAFGRAVTSQLFPECTAEQMRWLDEIQKVSATAENAVCLESEMHQVNVRHLLPAVGAPTLILHSPHDASVPFSEGQLLAAEIPQAQFVPIETRNHLILEQEPAWPDYMEAINRFLADEGTAVPAKENRLSMGSSELVSKQGLSVHKLPTQVTPFIGREAELALIQEMLANPECRLLTLVGLGGQGKSRLALEAARQAQDEGVYAARVAFVPLVGVADVMAVPGTIAEVLGISLSGRDAPLKQLLKILKKKQMLLVLDNVEHLLGDDQPVDGAVEINRLLDHCPDVKLLITSREPLNLAVEWRLVLEGLPYPEIGERSSVSSGVDQVDGLPITDYRLQITEYPAVQLFVQTAVQNQLDFTLTDANATVVARICEMAGGMPLAIKLAATWLRLIPLNRIAEEMEHGLNILASRMRDVPERQRSLRVVFDYTWELLIKPEQELFSALSVFRGGFTEKAATQVAHASPFLLAGLVDRGLVQQQAPPAGARYELHELTRQYGAERLANNSIPQINHARFFAEFIQGQNTPLRCADFATAVVDIAADLNNIQAAWNYLFQLVEKGEQTDLALELLTKFPSGLQYYFYLKGPLQTAKQMFLAAVAVMDTAGWEDFPEDHPARALLVQCRVRAAFFCLGVGEYEAVDQQLEKALPWLRQRGDVVELAFALSVLGKTTLLRGQRDQAEEPLLESLALMRQIGDRNGEADILKVLGVVAVDGGDYEGALAYYQDSLALFEADGFKPGMTMLLHNIGTALFRQEKYEAARESYERALRIATEIDYGRIIMETGGAMGGVYRVIGRYDRAEQYYKQAVRMADEMGEQRLVSINLRGLGMNYLAINNLSAAEESLQKGIAVGWRTENVPEALAGMATLAQTWAQQGRLEDGLKLAFFISQQPAVRATDREQNDAFLAELIQELRPSIVTEVGHWAAEQTLSDVIKLILDK